MDQIWCAVRDNVVMHIANVMGGIHLQGAHAQLQMHPHFSISGTAVRIALKFVMVKEQLVQRVTQAMSGAYVHVRTCLPLFRISGTIGRIALKFGVWLETH